jgi:hypothetical protein
MTAADAWSWIVAHDWQIVSLTTYVLLNIGPRPHPDRLDGPSRIFWTIVDRLSVLSAERVPGAWKMLLAKSPVPADVEEAVASNRRPSRIPPPQVAVQVIPDPLPSKPDAEPPPVAVDKPAEPGADPGGNPPPEAA